jgi:hypothetical protein
VIPPLSKSNAAQSLPKSPRCDEKPLVTVALAPNAVRLELPRALWAALHIGDRLIVTTNAGDVFPPIAVELGAGEVPLLVLPWLPESDATRATIRRAAVSP